MACDKCLNGWQMDGDEMWKKCRCMLEAEYIDLCHRPNAGYDDEMPIPDQDQIITGAKEQLDRCVNSLVRSYFKENTNLLVLHILSSTLTNDRFNGHDIDPTAYDLVFITLSDSPTSVRGEALCVGGALDERQFSGLRTFLLSSKQRGTLAVQYEKAGTNFHNQLRDLEPRVLGGLTSNTDTEPSTTEPPVDFDPSSAL